ncbi:MAG: hypothetical protein NZM12_01335, partial [Steroidobacteraceae bacterium]|nr:hypothetical protein [Steroidobacteraceae bacterium]MDW8258665.1 hypothetical protein [Gammaproteobacteria bacterium]
ELQRLGVDVRLERPIDPAQPPQADRVIWAIGAAPAQTAVWRLRPYLRHGIPGADRVPHGRDYLAGQLRVRGVVTIIDEELGWPTLTLLMRLLEDPAVERVEIFTAEPIFGATAVTATFESGALKTLLASAREKITIHSNTMIQAIENNHLIINGAAVKTNGPRLLMTGTAARAVPPGALAVGDCVAPRGLGSATADALRLVDRLLREAPV